MRIFRVELVGLVLSLVSAQTLAANPRASLAREYLQESALVDLSGPVAEWDKALREGLQASHDPAKTAAKLSSRYDLSQSIVSQLIDLWFQATILSWKDDPDKITEAKHQSLDRQFIALAETSGHNKLVLAVAAEAISYIGRCDPDSYRALIGAPPTSASVDWSIVAQVGYCTSWLAAFSDLHPDHAAAVEVKLALDEELSQPSALALSEYLAGDYLQTHATAADYQTLRARFAYLHIEKLWDVGLLREGLDFYQTLPEATQRQLTDTETASELSVTVDGLSIQHPKRLTNLTADLLAARYVLNVSNNSQKLQIPAGPLDASRSLLKCWRNYVPPETGGGNGCNTDDSPGTTALLDLAILTPADDPYDFLEYYYGQGSFVTSPPSRGSGLWTQALCKRLGGGRYSSICQAAESALDPWESGRVRDKDTESTEAAAESAFAGVAGHALAVRTSHFKQELINTFGEPPKIREHETRGRSIEPLPSPFIEERLPDAMRSPRGKGDTGNAPPAWSAKYSALPSGFSPVRVDHSGSRVVVISVSQTLDPTGEVSAGGYWVHLSNDSGRTWQDPLYTGLAERFPYVVRSHSKLPVFDGETLRVEVDVEELDTRSIFYPPVALRSKRRAKNRYLRIPIAELRQDSDGDGISDIVEKHLLLDPHNADTDGDGIPDGRDSMPNVRRGSSEDLANGALAAAIEKLFDVRMGAIVEGIDRAGGTNPVEQMAGGRVGEPLAQEHPIFIEGDASDFAALNPSRVVLVYNKAQIAELQRMTPDFHAVSFDRLILNDAQNRGYLIWNSGWSGGTFRLVREGNRWKVLDLSRWIT